MRRLVVLLAISAALFAPGLASARHVERYCTEADVAVYGRTVLVVPEQCVDCPYMICSLLPPPAPPPGAAGSVQTGRLPVQVHLH